MVEDSKLKFSNTILTNIGHQMLTSISNGNRKITYTKAEAYAQDVSSISNETLKALTSLQGKELSANLLVSNDSGDVVTITANFRNKGLTKDVVFNSIGWFAKLDTDDAERGITANQEYLIGITPASDTQTLVAPPADQSSSQAISINLNMKLSDASNVNMTVSDAGAVHFNQLHDELVKYTTTADLTKLLAGKADLGLSYTKAEIDAKLLDLTTDTSGKVSADQVKALINNKANISDVYTKSQIDSALSTRDTQINTKANASDVYTKSQIDSDFSARDTQINTKANISDVYTKSDVDSALAVDRGRLDKLEGTQTLDSPDFNSITSTGVYYITNNTPANIKNNPVSQWGVLVVSNGDGHRISQVYYPDDGSPQWCRLLNESNWLPWYQLSTKKDISNAVSQANKAQDTANQANTKAQNALDNKADKTTVEENLATKANQSDLDQTNAEVAKKANSEDVTSQINSKTTGTIVTAYDIANKTPTKETNSYTNKWLVDAAALGQFADQINQLKGRRLADAPDFNTLTDTGTYFISKPWNGKNVPNNYQGVLVVFNTSSNSNTRIIQIFSPDYMRTLFVRTYGWINSDTTWGSWNEIAWKSNITNLQNQIQQLKDNQFEVQTFTDATAAANWEAQRPGKRMAIVNS